MTSPAQIRPSAGRAQRGFSLVELMIAMTIGLFLVAGVGYVFLGTKATYGTLEGLSRIQENARYAFEYIGRDIRMAGFTGGPPGFEDACQNLVSMTSGEGWSKDDLKDLCGTNSGPLKGYDDGLDDSADGATSAITVVHADADREYTLEKYEAFNRTFTVTLPDGNCPTSGLPKAGDILVAADYTGVAVFSVAAANCSEGTMTLAHPDDTVLPPFHGADGARKLYPLRAATYYIRENPRGKRALYRRELDADKTTATEIVEGVEDMQIFYGEDAADDKADEVTVYHDEAEKVGDWNRVLSLRIELKMFDPADAQLTKTFRHTIALRNRLL